MNHGIYEISQRENNILMYCDTISPDMVSVLAKAMKGRILVSAAAKPYISVRTAQNEPPLETLKCNNIIRI